ncbi:MAG: TrkA family potassium uptake protein [Acidaminococcus sp.]|jgi:trk system potassium uptake protein TrkA|nr:TrkA family potassium uptake protein [Acidaminococcus sp.]MCI2100315.1 TrkA family potassium uptake protein [Acidaminococcus sp.]MCI2114609.1 TrkA family potassium uptake protein [Acidaminococcus sp.]MCI2116612.1 TrkA family potassium uptake protein [Acidaminococcus sp.]
MGKTKQFVVWGLGRFGSSVALTLAEMGHEVLGIDNNEEVVQNLASQLTHVVVSDAIDENVVKSLGLRNFDAAIIAIGDLEPSLLCCMLLKEAGLHKIVAKASSPIHGKMLKKIGATSVIYPERDMGRRVGHSLGYTNILDFVELSDDIALVEIDTPTSAVGKNLIELDVRRRFGVNIVAIKHPDKKIEISMDPKKPLQNKDVLVIIGNSDSIKQLRENL